MRFRRRPPTPHSPSPDSPKEDELVRRRGWDAAPGAPPRPPASRIPDLQAPALPAGQPPPAAAKAAKPPLVSAKPPTVAKSPAPTRAPVGTAAKPSLSSGRRLGDDGAGKRSGKGSGAGPDPRGAAGPQAPLTRGVRSEVRPSHARRTGSFRSPEPLRRIALVSGGEKILFGVLLASVIGMSIFLVRYREHMDAHFQSRVLAVPLAEAGARTTPTPLMLYLANDDTGSLVERPLAFPLPEDPNTRARVVLAKLLSEYATPGSPHPLPPQPAGVEGVDEVYLAPVPGGAPHTLLAVVDLTPAFIHSHPSGIEPETLTLLSMIATLHANLPAVTEVRFLVDGEPRATLAGHADLSHTYLAGAAQIAPGEAFTSRRP